MSLQDERDEMSGETGIFSRQQTAGSGQEKDILSVKSLLLAAGCKLIAKRYVKPAQLANWLKTRIQRGQV